MVRTKNGEIGVFPADHVGNFSAILRLSHKITALEFAIALVEGSLAQMAD